MELFRKLNEAKLHSKIHFEGLDISVEVPAGGYRRGKNKKTGEEWAHKIPDHYGYIKGTHSPDGEHLDCYLRKNPKSDSKVYVMHQLTVDGSKFDEDKVMLGYSNKNEAIKAFKEVTFKPNTMYGGCTEFDMEHFQVIAFSASNSHAMLTNSKTYEEFQKKGLLGKGIKSPIMVARKVSESLSEGLNEISSSLNKGDLIECLEQSGFYEGYDIQSSLDSAWSHYQATSEMHLFGSLSEAEFKERALQYVMETDSLLTDVEDSFPVVNEEIRDDYDHDFIPVVYEVEKNEPNQELEESVPANNFVVVVHTQIMENIGSESQPSWATAGSKVVLVQEGFSTWGDARAVAAKVSAGEIDVELSEGAYVLGIDVMPTGEYRQFYEEAEIEEPVEETTTDDVFFAQQIMESRKLAGIKPVSYAPRSVPTIQDTKAVLEKLSLDEAPQVFKKTSIEDNEFNLTQGQRAHALRTARAALVKNPRASVNNVLKAVCKKLYGDPTLDEEIIKQAEFEYGSLDRFENVSRGLEVIDHGPRTITKVSKE